MTAGFAATASYAPGTGVALVGRRAWALLQVSTGSPVVEALLPGIEAGRPVVELLDVLLQKGLADLPSFALVHLDTTSAGTPELRVVVRGDAVVGLRTDAGPVEVDAHGLTSWREHVVPVAPSVIVAALPGTGVDLPSFPTGGGVVLADRLEITLSPAGAAGATGTGDEGAPPALPAAPLRAVAVASAPATELSETAAPEAPVVAPEHSDHTLTFRGEPEPVVDVPADGPVVEAPGDDVPLVEEPVVEEPVVEEPVVEEPSSYDYLFGDTINRPPMVPVAPLAPVPDPAPPTAVIASPPVAVAPVEPVEVAEPVAAVAPAAGGGLIDSVPWASSPSPAPAPPTATAPTAAPTAAPAAPPTTGPTSAPVAAAPAESAAAGVQDEPDDRTVKRSDLEALVRERAAQGDRVGPMVHAVSCPHGHLNDPQSGVCRRCRAALPDQDPVTVPRPVLGVLRLSTGDLVQLDRGVLLGRSPSTDVEGVERPHLVKVSSPGNEISRNHLSLVLDGWHVVVSDLRTTNGTLVQLPGADPQRLRPEDPQPIDPGTVVTLADGVSFTYEVEP